MPTYRMQSKDLVKLERKMEESEMDDVTRFIAKFPSLKLADPSKESSSAKIHCSLTGHDIPCRVAELEKYVQGKKFRKAQERSEKEFEKYKPHIIPSTKKGRTHQLFCTLTLRHMNRLPAHVERHVNGRRYKKALQRYEECKRQGIRFKPLSTKRKREDDSEGEGKRKFSKSAFSESSESEAESEDSMSDLYPREYFDRLSPENQNEACDDDVDDDSGSDFEFETMNVSQQSTSRQSQQKNKKKHDDSGSEFEFESIDVEQQSTSRPSSENKEPDMMDGAQQSVSNAAVKRKKKIKKGGRRKFPKQPHHAQQSQSQKPFFKKGALKQPRKEKAIRHIHLQS